MIFHPSGWDELRTDLIINSQYPTTLATSTQFHANSEDPSHQQEIEENLGFPDWIAKQHHRPPTCQWTFLFEQQFLGSESPKMTESNEVNLSWFHKTEPAAFSNPFIHQYISESDSNQDDERNNNNVNIKAHLLNFSMKNSGYFHEEDEKENLAWIPFSNLMTTTTKSPSIAPEEEEQHVQSSNLLNMCRQDKEGEDHRKQVPDSSSFDQYIEWKSKLSQWDNNINPSSQIEDKISLSAQQHKQQQQLSALESELLEKLEPIEDSYYDEEDETHVGGITEDGENDGINPDNSDLVTFLSKFPAIAAIWGQEIVNETSINGNPWNNEQNKRTDKRPFPSTSIFNFQHIEDENMDQGKNDILASAARKYSIVNAATTTAAYPPPENEYIINGHGNQDQDNKYNNNNLGLLNHSEKSGFIKFIPLYSNQNQSSKFTSLQNNTNNSNQEEEGKEARLLKDMLNNLELDAEEQEIVAACSQTAKSLGEETTDDDLLTSWKTHFRPVGALETQNEVEVTSPTSTLSQSQLPEFRTDYNENEYVLYRGSSAFQIRFKLCSENEKGNQTDDFSHATTTSNASFNSDFQLGSIHTPMITDYGNQFYDWLSGPFDEEQPKDIWSNGGQFLDSSCIVHDLCCEEVYDEYEKLNNDNDSDYGFSSAVSSFCFPGGSSNGNNNKQSKSSRRRAKGRPCKYFFMDGSCRRGKECKFSHDLITCRFWAEGQCLKGQSCPFLHCFLDAKDFENHNELNTNYQLESEMDFPALGTTKISSRVPIISEEEGGSDDEGNTSIIMNNNSNKKSDDEDEEEAGYSQQNHLNNWIALISTNGKRKK